MFLTCGIKYSRPQIVFTSYIKKRDVIDNQRKEFSKILSKILNANEPIIYVDETTFNTWTRRAKTWQKPSQPVEVYLNPKR